MEHRPCPGGLALMDGKWVVIVVVHPKQGANNSLDARQNSGSILEEIGNFTELWANQGKGIVFMVDFNMRI